MRGIPQWNDIAERWTSDVAEDTDMKLTEEIKKKIYFPPPPFFALQLDESTDIQNNTSTLFIVCRLPA
jgi:hypothetical protein